MIDNCKFSSYLIGPNKLVILAILVICLLSVSSYPVDAKGETIRVGVYQYEPVVFTDDDGMIRGFYIDILEHIASKEGWNIEYVPCPWAECLERLETGEIDLLVAIAYSEERGERFDFTNEAVVLDWGQIYTRSDLEIQSILDLDQKTVIGLREDIYYLSFQPYSEQFGISCNFIEADDYPTVFGYLENKTADAGIIPRLYNPPQKKDYDVYETPIIFSPIEMRFAVPKGKNKEILETIDKHMVALKGNRESIYYQSQNKWLASVVEFEIPGWIKLAVGFGGGLLLFFIAASAVLNTQVKRKTAELSDKNEELMADIVERKRAEEMLQKANEDLKSLDKMKDEFISNVSHELKTPLVSITGYSELVDDRSLGEINDEQKKALDTVLRNSERLRHLVDSLLFISKVQAGAIEYAFEKVQIAEIINDAIQDMFLEIKKKHLSLERNVPGDLPLINGDKGKLTNILTSILDNAIKFTPSGGLITVSAIEEDENVHIIVSDTGIGIKKELMPNLFQRFYQVDASIRRRYGGTGLGLYICKNIVEGHKGNIWIESEEGKGTTVHVTLPK
ncbi:His Kinase A (phospho-acceptor) domain-containing protein [Methanococcoides vulcani]|uniref:histidine kinase n=1 Tax=Methanococcoides vulcani TaxID=1353158 RepID=A0A1I0ADM4_9EURY|nr:ATP-binding protein [Methanococcoides vulcani]SES92356.1 His Kinase A (phospho-acceptor) domain-containing protein [Methanococcoides vulcani]